MKAINAWSIKNERTHLRRAANSRAMQPIADSISLPVRYPERQWWLDFQSVADLQEREGAYDLQAGGNGLRWFSYSFRWALALPCSLPPRTKPSLRHVSQC
jgi:hypothetical protein